MTGEDTAAAVTSARPEGPGGLLRFVALLVLVGLLAMLLRGALTGPGSELVDAEAAAAELLAQDLPFGLELAGAVRTPGGDRVVTFERSGEGEGPDELLFIDYPDPGRVAAAFRKTDVMLGMKMAEWKKDPKEPWHGTLRLADIGWGPWTARLKIERSFEAGGGWSDLAQVDLSRPKRPRALFARWPREVEASETQLRRILAALRLEPAEEDQ
jgi:hypothetical protein